MTETDEELLYDLLDGILDSLNKLTPIIGNLSRSLDSLEDIRDLNDKIDDIYTMLFGVEKKEPEPTGIEKILIDFERGKISREEAIERINSIK